MKTLAPTGAALIAALLLAPGTVRAQGQPNCADPQTQTEMNICAGQAYRAADAELNRAYEAAMAEMKDTDAHLPKDLRGAEKALRAAQRAWIPFRDNACAAEGFAARGGTMESMLVASCLEAVTRQRTTQLLNLARGIAN